MFVEARRPDLPKLDREELSPPLTPLEYLAFVEIYKIHWTDNPLVQVDVALAVVTTLMYEMEKHPYAPSIDKKRAKSIRKKYVEPVAYPAGRDLQAIALGYLVSAFMTHERGELGECWKQLKMLHTQLEPAPFEF